MASNVVGLFDTYEQAHYTVQQLLASGFGPQQISVVASDQGGTIQRKTVDETGTMAGEGAVSGGASGLLVGGLIGLLVGATTLAAPPVGFVIAGPIAGMLAGAGIGMVAGGVLGALIGLGIPEEEAHIYAESVRRGGVIVSVEAVGAEAVRAQQIFAQGGAVNITERAALYRSHGFTTYDPKAAVLTPAEVAADRARLGLMPSAASTVVSGVTPGTVVSSVTPGAVPGSVVVDEVVQTPAEAALESSYRSHYQANYAANAWGFENVRPAYQFGHDLAFRTEFRGLDWSVIEPQARLLWERANPTVLWDQIRDGVHFGWSQARLTTPATGATII
jgi:hypothetical protein